MILHSPTVNAACGVQWNHSVNLFTSTLSNLVVTSQLVPLLGPRLRRGQNVGRDLLITSCHAVQKIPSRYAQYSMHSQLIVVSFAVP